MPEELFLLSMLAITAGTFLVIYLIWQIASYAKSRHANAGGAGSLGVSELEAILRRVVREELEEAAGSAMHIEREEGRLLDGEPDPRDLIEEDIRPAQVRTARSSRARG